MSKINYQKLNDDLRIHISTLVKSWFPRGTQKGSEWIIGNIHGDEGDTFYINLNNGKFYDFGDKSCKGANIISLYARKNGVSNIASARKLVDLCKLNSADYFEDHSVNAKLTEALRANNIPSEYGATLPKIGSAHFADSEMLFTKAWTYRDGEGRPYHYRLRYEKPQGDKVKKIVIPYSYFQNEGWKFKALGWPKNPLYGFELLSQDATKPILIVEGEKTADVAREVFPDHLCVSWMGGVQAITKADWSPLQGRNIVYWPDNDKAGRESVAVIISCLSAAKIQSLRCVQLPSILPPKWDLADSVPDGIDLRTLLSKAEEHDLTASTPFHLLEYSDLAERLVYVSETDQFVDRETMSRFVPKQINSLFRHLEEVKGGSIERSLLEERELTKVVGFTYSPTVEKLLYVNAKGLAVLNLWKGSGLMPREGDPEPFINHLRILTTTDEEFEHLASWLAYLVQYPGEKIKHAPVLVGPPGSGKSLLCWAMKKILGVQNTTDVETHELKGNFNEWLEAKLLIVCEEVLALGRTEIMNRLKPLITQPLVGINVKHLRAYTIENRANFIMLSNHDDALKLEDDDRRFFVINSKKPPSDKAYFKALWEWIDKNVDIVLWWLLQRDLRGFNPHGHAPMTEGKKTMIALSKTDLVHRLSEMITNYEEPFEQDLVELSTVMSYLTLNEQTVFGIKFSRPMIARAMQLAGCRNFGQKKGYDENKKEIKKSLWAVRDVISYEQLPSASLVKAFLYPERKGQLELKD